MNFSAFEIIVNDIRDMRQLTIEQKNIISSFTDEQKIQIIHIYDEMIKYAAEYINFMCLQKDNK